MFVLLYRACTNVILGILETRLCVYIYAVLEGIYKCETEGFCDKPLCLCLCFCRGYVHK